MAAALVWVLIEPNSVAPRAVLAAVLIAYIVASVYAVPAAVCAWLNGGSRRLFSRGDVGPGRTALVLLSGRVETVRGWDGRKLRVLTRPCAARVLEAARVYELIAPEWVVSAGGLPNPAERVQPAAEVMRDRLIELGVPASRILVESASRDTHDEAVNVAAMLRNLEATQLVLVTSESHIARAMGAFRAQGLTPIAAPSPDPDHDRRWLARTAPSQHGLRFSGEILHELLGILYYRLRGWYAAPERPSATAP